MKKIRVAVIMGGNSSEREVSLISGREIERNLNSEKYEVKLIDWPKDIGEMKDFEPEVAFLALHGGQGEDGTIQGYLETLGIRYTGCGVLASAVGMDKQLFRKVMESSGVPMPKLTNVIPCVVKPANGGSSVGVTMVKEEAKLDDAIALAKKYDSEVLVEEYVSGMEVSCGVMGNDKIVALPVIEICPKNEFFDYEAKYTAGKCEEICPARLSEELTKRVQNLSLKVFEAVKARGYARVDLMIRENEVLVLEINTLPGMTQNSLLPKEAKVAGISYEELLDRMIELAME